MITETIVGWFNGLVFRCMKCDRHVATEKQAWFPVLAGRDTEVLPDMACADCGEVF